MNKIINKSSFVQLASVLGTMFLMPFFVFSSIMILNKDAHKFFHFFFDTNFLNCGLQGVILSVFGFNRTKMNCDEIYCHFDNPKKVLRDFGVYSDIKRAFSIILIYFVVCQIMTYLLMRYRLKK